LPDLVDEPDPSLPMNTRISLLELSLYMRSVLLRDSDVMSMANSIELRVPFLDHRLVSFALKNHLAGNGKKQVLLDSLQKVLPAHTMLRKKQGFELPMSGWFHGVLQGFCDEGLDNLQKGAVLGIAATEFKQRFLSGELSWARLWQAVVLGHWLKRFNASALTGVAGSGDHLG
jgi:asparagine synthase (glutamine-hydrolysing)